MIPWGASVHVHWNTGTYRERRLGLWIPLIVVWLILVPLVLVLFPLVALGCLFVGVSAVRLYATAFGVVNSLRRTLVEVRSPGFGVRVDVA